MHPDFSLRLNVLVWFGFIYIILNHKFSLNGFTILYRPPVWISENIPNKKMGIIPLPGWADNRCQICIAIVDLQYIDRRSSILQTYLNNQGLRKNFQVPPKHVGPEPHDSFPSLTQKRAMTTVTHSNVNFYMVFQSLACHDLQHC